jgi:phosphate starvation-inducible protein PhoH and related proteins
LSRKSMRVPRLTRREKQAQERQAKATPKFETASPKPMPRLVPKNERQKQARACLSSGRSVVILMGSAGTGKSMLACERAAELLNNKKTGKLYLGRPAVGVGKSIGLLPGEVDEKLGPYFAQTITHLEYFLGKSFVEYALANDVIEMQPIEYLRGVSFEDCVVIFEEAQNFTAEEFEMCLTRMGENCLMIFTGDTKQHDLKGDSGLDVTLDLIDKMLQTQPEYMTHEDLDTLDDEIGVVQFKPEDVVRSGLTKALVTMYYHNS